MEEFEVVVAILNKDNANRLRLCLESLVAQTFREFNVVVIDGNSKDDSLNILHEFSQKDKRIHYIIQKTEGTGNARNEVIDYVKKAFPNCSKIVWGDSENVYDVEYLARIVNACKDKDFTIVGGKNVIDSDTPISQALWWYYNGLPGIQLTVSGNNECVPMKVYETHRYPNMIRGDDSVFHLELQKEGYKFYKSLDAACYITTVETFKDFINWTRKKALGLYQGATYKKGLLRQTVLHYLSFNVLTWIYLIIFFFVYSNLILLVSYVALPLIASFYLWYMGKPFVKNMRKITFLYFIPIILLHLTLMFFELIRLDFITRLRDKKKKHE
jgi:glycosyltransferase involved in cell wall biosynthesis